MTDSLLEVAAAVIVQAGKILVAKRAPTQHQGGKWEFPGGKLEVGETAKQALVRELEEELGIQVRASRPLIQIKHAYPEKTVRLSVFKVSRFTGNPQGREGQPIQWVTLAEMNGLEFPAANSPIIQAVNLPEICGITPPKWDGPAEFLASLRRNLSMHQLVVLRLPGLSARSYTELAIRAVEIAQKVGTRLLLTSSAEEVMSLGAAGLHLNSQRLMHSNRRPLGMEGRLISAACHSVEQLRQAQKLSLDFVFLSPVKPTTSHPDAAPLGWPCFSEWVSDCRIPVYALGGMRRSDIGQSFQQGAQGIAGISGIWQP